MRLLMEDSTMTDRRKCAICGALVYEDTDKYGVRIVCIAGHTVAEYSPERRPLGEPLVRVPHRAGRGWWGS